MTKLEIKVPTFVILPRKTKDDLRIALNLNIYRNLHHSVNGQAKKIFKNQMIENLEHDIRMGLVYGFNFENPVKITYYITNPSKRKLDIANVGAVVDKFTCDALVDCGIIRDDNYNYVKEIKFVYAGYKKDCYEARVVIEEYKEEEFMCECDLCCNILEKDNESVCEICGSVCCSNCIEVTNRSGKYITVCKNC